MRRRVAVLLLAALGAAHLAAAGAPALTWEEAEAAGLTIGRVVVAAGDVFDPRLPDERHLLGRAANAIHRTTRDRVVRAALLFAPGERVDAARIRESERRLRGLVWIIDAAIDPVGAGPGIVDALVRTHDGWSLSLGVKYNRAGGDAVWRLSVDEDNLLGWGKQLSLARERDLDRSTTEVVYRDPLFAGGDWTLEAAYRDLSDGWGRRLRVERPYHELTAAWSAGGEIGRAEIDVERYQRGEVAYRFPARLEDVRLSWSRPLRIERRTAWRAGLEVYASERAYGELEVVRPGLLDDPDLRPQRLRGLLAAGEVSQDRYESRRNLRSVEATEDVNLGWDATFKAGRLGRAFGGDVEAWYAEGRWRGGAGAGDGVLLLHEGEGRVRLEDGDGARDTLLRARESLYWQGLPLQTIAALADLTWSRRLDPEHAIYLGGFEGLRGYPNRFREGDRRWLLSVEDRVVTPLRLWGIAQVGFVAYADAGAIAAAGGGFGKTWGDVGAGLRFGNLKGTLTRVVQLTVAVPLVREEGVPRWQVIAGNTARF